MAEVKTNAAISHLNQRLYLFDEFTKMDTIYQLLSDRLIDVENGWGIIADINITAEKNFLVKKELLAVAEAIRQVNKTILEKIRNTYSNMADNFESMVNVWKDNGTVLQGNQTDVNYTCSFAVYAMLRMLTDKDTKVDNFQKARDVFKQNLANLSEEDKKIYEDSKTEEANITVFILKMSNFASEIERVESHGKET